jgi:hypothetical protein
MAQMLAVFPACCVTRETNMIDTTCGRKAGGRSSSNAEQD